MEWFSIKKVGLPKKAGWYAVSISPRNHKECSLEATNEWRDSFGFDKGWFNPDAVYKFWIADHTTNEKSYAVDERITHWGYLPKAPVMTVEDGYLRDSPQHSYGGENDGEFVKWMPIDRLRFQNRISSLSNNLVFKNAEGKLFIAEQNDIPGIITQCYSYGSHVQHEFITTNNITSYLVLP